MPNNWLSILCKTNTLTLCVHIARSLVANVRNIKLHLMTLCVWECVCVCVSAMFVWFSVNVNTFYYTITAHSIQLG